ncbi:MAG TPA: HipA domain-containing protein [Acidimicrobiales bacterium]|nr:HipA domain-containing protein [Acidimicrobiales bacterium]
MAKSDQELAIWLNGQRVATLTKTRRGLGLAYEISLVKDIGVGSLCLSVALPVREKPYSGEAVDRWVRGMLPEGETLSEIERRFNVSRGDSFGLFAAIGYDCAGAISIVGEQFQVSENTSARQLSEGDLVRAIEDLPSQPLGVNEEVRVSLGGLQAKLLLCRTADGWERPALGVPTTHILKPDPVEFPGLVASEYYAMKIAEKAGLNVAHVEFETIGERQVLIVERFDRRVIGGKMTRVHQEDGCQSLGLDPERDKYQRIGYRVPSYEALAKVISDHAIDPAIELRALGAAMVLTVALGNTDGHARNHSFLIEAGALSFAPIYDVAPTMAFVAAKTTALAIAGEKQIIKMTRHRLAVEMQSWGLTKIEASDVVNETYERIASVVNEIDPGLAPEKSVETVREQIRRMSGA